jgi:tRNA pseudouridine38-40 synthase
MPENTVQLVLHYDGGGFAGWQRQPAERTVQGVLEESLLRLCETPIPVLGSGRTDAGVHARGQAVGVRLASGWTARSIRRALNAVLPQDVWVAAAYDMHPAFHARYSATGRRYSYYIGTDDGAHSPFRRRHEWAYVRPVERSVLDRVARTVLGTHAFRGFAVRGTAPATDDHRCTVRESVWRERPGGLVYEVEANRFLHHMVRFLVGTMLDVASGRRGATWMDQLLTAVDNRGVSPPAPAHALFLERVDYPADLYLLSA